MKLLFDHNLSPRLVDYLGELFPQSDHVYNVNLSEAPDREVWEYAHQHNFTIVTKDADFSDLSVLLKHYADIKTLIDDKERSILVLF